MAKKSRLMDEVLEALPRKGFSPWFERLSPDLQEELCEIRELFWRGQLQSQDGRIATKTGLSFLLAEKLSQRGVDIGHSGVAKWLARGKPTA